MDIKHYIHEHPYITGGVVIVGGIAFLVLTRGGGSSSGASDSATSNQQAQINAAAQIQAMQIQAQLQVASIQAGVANNQTAAQLAALKLNADATVSENATNTNAKLQVALSQQDVYKAMITAARDEQLSTDAVTQAAITQKNQLIKAGIDLTGKPNRFKEGTNIVALLTNQGSIQSYNDSGAVQALSSALMWSNVTSSLSKLAAGFLG